MIFVAVYFCRQKKHMKFYRPTMLKNILAIKTHYFFKFFKQFVLMKPQRLNRLTDCWNKQQRISSFFPETLSLCFWFSASAFSVHPHIVPLNLSVDSSQNFYFFICFDVFSFILFCFCVMNFSLIIWSFIGEFVLFHYLIKLFAFHVVSGARLFPPVEKIFRY